MLLRDVLNVLNVFASAEIETVVEGGWGIDALLGEQTRSHEDLDLVVDRRRLEDSKKILSRRGLTHDAGAWPGMPARTLMRGQRMTVDLHPVTFDAAKNGWQQLTENSWGLYTANGLNGMGLIGPRPVRCITAAIQLRHHLGYEWGEKEIGDISRLHDRFGLPLPPDLAHPVATSPHVRPARQEHQAFLERMLLLVIRWQHEASNVEGNDQSALDERALRYVEDWGRPGDLGFIAATADEKLGAAWCRYFDPDRPGYGYMDQDVPELSIAVARPHRGTGIGTALMRALIDKVIERGDRGVTSSIEDGNPARRLYERLGFRTVRRDVGARVMLLDITPTFSDEP